MRPSLLVEMVLRCLADHPHDNTVGRLTTRLGDIGDADAVQAALALLLEDGLVVRSSGHFALSAGGWRLIRSLDQP